MRARSRSVKVVGLVSVGHFCSHFYMLLIPPLFPVLREVYGVGFTELGLAVACFSVTTGVTHAPVGFLVDRYGARAILIAGVLVESLAIGLIGVFPFYGALLVLMVLAGFANAAYHPADYAILSATVTESRMGRAFSVHTFAGYLGTAVGPAVVIPLATAIGWRAALLTCAALGATVGILMAFNSRILSDAARSAEPVPAAGPGSGADGWRLLFSTPILMGLLFFTALSMGHHGITDFSVSALNLAYGASLAQAGAVLSAFLFASPLGVLLGGWVADRIPRYDRIAVVCLVGMGLAVFAVAALPLPLWAVTALFVVAGLFNGIVAPSRDLMIRALTPATDMGKVFGFVSSGYSIGGVVAPVAFGYLLDHADAGLVFWSVGAISLLTVGSIVATGRQARTYRTRVA